MNVEQLRDELHRIVIQGAGHLPVKVEVPTITIEYEVGRESTEVTEHEDVPVVDLRRINSGSTFLRLIVDEDAR